MYIVSTCKAVKGALQSNIVLSKSSFCGQKVKYLALIGINDYVSAKATLRLSFHIDTTTAEIDTLINYLANEITEPMPEIEMSVEELAASE
jgi:selenocysteine lyase/cysteine desulfurase